jgi:hypothetical protein
MDFKKHKRKGALSELRQVIFGEDLIGVSISDPDKKLMQEQPNVFAQGYIARNPDNHNDMWYVSKEYYDKNLEEVKSESNENLNFGQAIEAAKQGKRVARSGWNGSGMFAYIVPAASYPAQTGAAKAHFGENGMVPYREYWALKTAQGDVATWAPSGSDTLAEDWYILD